MASSRPVPFALTRAAARWLVLGGVVVALLLAALPLRATIEGDPLLRLRQLDPQLAPLSAGVSCGRPLDALDARSEGPAFHLVAAARACRDAARRRLSVAAALGAILVVAALIGRQGARQRATVPHLASDGAPT